MNIFLIGFMGAGKSTFGRKLALQMTLPFFDLDELIIANIGESIASYFEKKGEQAFRMLEKTILQQTAFPADYILACGGGCPCFHDNLAWMQQRGITIYLRLPVSVLAKRLQASKTNRPLLKGKTAKALVDLITQKLSERESYYKQARLIVGGETITTALLIPQLKNFSL